MNTVLVDVPHAEAVGAAVRAGAAPARWRDHLLRRPQPRLGADVAALTAAATALELELVPVGPQPASLWPSFLALLILGFLGVSRTYRAPWRRPMLDDLRQLVQVGAAAAMTVVPLRVLLTDDPRIAEESVGQWALVTVALLGGRLGLAVAERRGGDPGRRTLIVGSGPIGRLTAKRLLANPHLGLLPIGFVDEHADDPGWAPVGNGRVVPDEAPLDDVSPAHLPVLGTCAELDEVAARNGVEHVVVAFAATPPDVLVQLVRRCGERRICVSVVPRLFEVFGARLAVQHLGGLPILSTVASDPKDWRFAVKYAVDRVGALIAVVALLPVMAATALAVRLSMGKPVLYRQTRVGRDGRPFTILKFRSMRPAPACVDPEADTDDAAERSTRLGSFLRRSSLDELPQLFNVLRGEMSFVGPRPERPEFVELFTQRGIYRYDERHRIKAGITGWAQVHGIGRGRSRFSDVALSDRAEWDNYYIENWSLWLDVKIILMTLLAAMRFRQT